MCLARYLVRPCGTFLKYNFGARFLGKETLVMVLRFEVSEIAYDDIVSERVSNRKEMLLALKISATDYSTYVWIFV